MRKCFVCSTKLIKRVIVIKRKKTVLPSRTDRQTDEQLERWHLNGHREEHHFLFEQNSIICILRKKLS
jgi:hypothetical protein